MYTMSKLVSFEEIGGLAATFLAQEDVKKGCVGAVKADSTVGAAAAGAACCGVALDTPQNGAVAVQVGGFATLPVSGGVAPGWVSLTADGSGGVKATASSGGETGRTLLVVSTDSSAGTAVVLL